MAKKEDYVTVTGEGFSINGPKHKIYIQKLKSADAWATIAIWDMRDRASTTPHIYIIDKSLDVVIQRVVKQYKIPLKPEDILAIVLEAKL